MIRLGLYAAAGAIVGSLFRYLISEVFHSENLQQFPWATFTVNIVGALLIGLCARNQSIFQNEIKRTFIVTGVLGGFTTYSAFAVETINLFSANPFIACAYVVSTFGIGVMATSIALGRRL